MPELPEVETIRRQLADAVRGRTVVSACITRARAVRAHASIEDFVQAITGRCILEARRRGKALLFPLDDGNTLLIRLGMSGQVLLAHPGDPLRSHVHVVLSLDDGHELRFVDPRTFGEMAVVAGQDTAAMRELGHYGPEPLGESFNVGALRAAMQGKLPIEAALMDQRRVAGIGKIYADESCFRAGIDPRRTAGNLSDTEVTRLHAAIREVLTKAIAACGTSGADSAYRDAYGNLGAYQEQLCTYGRVGKPCRVCGTPIVTAPLQGRRMHYCPKCQK